MSFPAPGHVHLCKFLVQSENCNFGDIYEGTRRYTAEAEHDYRNRESAYQYLCHLHETKIWMEAILHEELPPTMDLEEGLRNGVYLAKLAHFTSPKTVPLSRIYDPEQQRYKVAGLQFRHTDNINYWLRSLEALKLPKTFHPTTADVYDKKNMPQVIFCLHALAVHLSTLNKFESMPLLYGVLQFSDDNIKKASKGLHQKGLLMPPFHTTCLLKSNGISILNVIADVNNAVLEMDIGKLLKALKNEAIFQNIIYISLGSKYLSKLQAATKVKESVSQKKAKDDYSTSICKLALTKNEIKNIILEVNMENITYLLQRAIKKKDESVLLQCLYAKTFELKKIDPECAPLYMAELVDEWPSKYSTMKNVTDWTLLLQQVIFKANKQKKNLLVNNGKPGSPRAA